MKKKVFIVLIFLSIISLMIIVQSDMIKKVEKIHINSDPNNCEFIEGLSPNYYGMIITATYQDGSSREIPLYKLKTNNYNPYKLGNQNIKVIYKEKSTTLKVHTRKKRLISMNILSNPDTLQYIEGMPLSLNGLQVEGIYDNHTIENIPNNHLNISGYNRNKIGDQTISVSSSDYKDTFEINVQPKKLLGIVIKDLPDKLKYPEGTSLNLTGFTVIANYDNNIPEEIPHEKLVINGFNSDTLGEKSININYNDFQDSFSVLVEEKKAIGLKIQQSPKKLTYKQGEKLDITGLKVQKIYDNEDVEDIPIEKLELSGYDENKYGKQNISIYFDSLKTNFTITMKVPESVGKIVTNPSAIDVLVNKTYSLPSNYVPSGLTKVKLPVAYTSYEANRMRRVAADALYNLYLSAKESGLNIVARSGYRSYSTQKSIYTSSVKRNGLNYATRYNAQPGHSEHQTGLTMDITCKAVGNKLSTSFENTPEGKWVKKNAHKFGFIIRYPRGKESITGYAYEPWHLRFIGVDQASKIYSSGLTMEEYYGIK